MGFKIGDDEFLGNIGELPYNDWSKVRIFREPPKGEGPTIDSKGVPVLNKPSRDRTLDLQYDRLAELALKLVEEAHKDITFQSLAHEAMKSYYYTYDRYGVPVLPDKRYCGEYFKPVGIPEIMTANDVAQAANRFGK